MRHRRAAVVHRGDGDPSKTRSPRPQRAGARSHMLSKRPNRPARRSRCRRRFHDAQGPGARGSAPSADDPSSAPRPPEVEAPPQGWDVAKGGGGLDTLVAETVGAFGRIDVVTNNASVYRNGKRSCEGIHRRSGLRSHPCGWRSWGDYPGGSYGPGRSMRLATGRSSSATPSALPRWPRGSSTTTINAATAHSADSHRSSDCYQPDGRVHTHYRPRSSSKTPARTVRTCVRSGPVGRCRRGSTPPSGCGSTCVSGWAPT